MKIKKRKLLWVSKTICAFCASLFPYRILLFEYLQYTQYALCTIHCIPCSIYFIKFFCKGHVLYNDISQKLDYLSYGTLIKQT